MSTQADKKGDAPSATKHPLFQLQGHHHRAIELRYEGKTYKEITGHVAMEFRKGVHPDTVKKWFGRGGLLEGEYMDYARGENDRRRGLMREELKKLVGMIPPKLEQIIKRIDGTGQPDMVALMGIKTLIEVLGVSANDERKPQDILTEYFKKIKTLPSPKSKDESTVVKSN